MSESLESSSEASDGVLPVRGGGLSLRIGGGLSLGKFLQFLHLQPGIQQLPDFLHLHLLFVQTVLQVHPRSNSLTFSCMLLMFCS